MVQNKQSVHHLLSNFNIPHQDAILGTKEWKYRYIIYIYTYLKFNICPEHLPSQKERIVCQLSFFSWHSLVFRIYLEKRYTYKYDDLGRETPPKFYSRPGLEVTFLAVTGDSESQTFMNPTRLLGGVKRLRLRIWNCRFKSSVPKYTHKKSFFGPESNTLYQSY